MNSTPAWYTRLSSYGLWFLGNTRWNSCTLSVLHISQRAHRFPLRSLYPARNTYIYALCLWIVKICFYASILYLRQTTQTFYVNMKTNQTFLKINTIFIFKRSFQFITLCKWVKKQSIVMVGKDNYLLKLLWIYWVSNVTFCSSNSTIIANHNDIPINH